jgi:formylmethanofuran dehydrogenase subunit C
MSALTFTTKWQPQARVNLSGLLALLESEGGAQSIGGQTVLVGTEHVPLGDLFDIQGNDPKHLVLVGDLSRVDGVGVGLPADSKILVEGSVGAYLGQGLQGGEIKVMGSAGHGLGLAMRKGRIEVTGDAGDFVGGALPGAMQGMAGGEIIIHGAAGERCGDRMRRGSIVVAGNLGDYAGSRMLAGSIVTLGNLGAHAGYAMKRGTLMVQGEVALDATFLDCGVHSLPIVNLMYRHWAGYGGAFSSLSQRLPKIHRSMGDRALDGKGEILRMVE